MQHLLLHKRLMLIDGAAKSELAQRGETRAFLQSTLESCLLGSQWKRDVTLCLEQRVEADSDRSAGSRIILREFLLQLL